MKPNQTDNDDNDRGVPTTDCPPAGESTPYPSDLRGNSIFSIPDIAGPDCPTQPTGRRAGRLKVRQSEAAIQKPTDKPGIERDQPEWWGGMAQPVRTGEGQTLKDEQNRRRREFGMTVQPWQL